MNITEELVALFEVCLKRVDYGRRWSTQTWHEHERISTPNVAIPRVAFLLVRISSADIWVRVLTCVKTRIS